ncbi:uncharacterized protein [Ambystoma mexicanum]|uniref:uncharacterized protein n=1 Tax=Ambystoma mexicanum TaxID=8296 RepID=UPI0037E8D057
MTEQSLAQVTIKMEEDPEDWQPPDEPGMDLYLNSRTLDEEYALPFGTGRRYRQDHERMASLPASRLSSSALHGSRSRMVVRRNDGRRRSVNWTVEELEGLLNALSRSPHLCLLMSSEHLSCINEWETVADDMGQDGFSRTADQCRLKMKSLRRVFHHLRLGWVSGGRQAPVLPPWFARMKELWRQAGKPRFKTPFIEAPPHRRYHHPEEDQEDNEAEAMDVKGDKEGQRKQEEQHQFPPSERGFRGEVRSCRPQQLPQALLPGNVSSVHRPNGVETAAGACEGSNAQHECDDEVQNVMAAALNSVASPFCTVSTRLSASHVELPQSSDETLTLGQAKASGKEVTLLEELNTRVRRLEESQQRTNELLQQLITVQTTYHQSSGHFLQEVLQRLDYSNQHMAMVGLLGHLGLVAKTQSVPGVQTPTFPPAFTPGPTSTVAPLNTTNSSQCHPSPSSSHQPLSDPQPMSSLPKQCQNSLAGSDHLPAQPKAHL